MKRRKDNVFFYFSIGLLFITLSGYLLGKLLEWLN